ncbi:MAG TPA: sugar ABC transporter substrate-binding protein [Ruminiclostridium sp.]
MKKFRLISLLLVILMVLSVFVGCGAPKKDSTGSSTSVTEQDKSQSTSSVEKTTLKYMTWSGGGQKVADEKAVKTFNDQNANIEVKIEFVDEKNYLSKLNTLVAAGSPPDIAFLNEYLVHDWGSKGTITNLTDKFNSSNLTPDKFVPGALFQSDGKIWGAAPGVEVILLYYNKEIYKKYGVETPSQDPLNPWTWDQYVESMKKVTTDLNGKHANEAGFNSKAIKVFGGTAPTFWLYYLPFLYSNNASLASPDGMSLALDTPEATHVLQSIADLVYKHKVAPTPAAQKGLPALAQMLANGQLASFVGGQWELSSFGEIKYDVGIAPLPIFKKSSNISWGSSVVIFEKSEHKDEAFKFLQYYIEPESSLQLSIDASWMPNMKEWYSSADLASKWMDNERHSEDFKKVVPKIATEVAQVPENVSLKNFGPIVDQFVTPQLDRLWLGQQSAEEAVKGLGDKVKDKMQGYWK